LIEQLALLCRRELAEAVEQQLVDGPRSRPKGMRVGQIHHESVPTLRVKALAVQAGKFHRQFVA
jgi:hypothetical protein